MGRSVAIGMACILACFAVFAYADPPDPVSAHPGWWDDDDYDTLIDACLSLVSLPAAPAVSTPFWTIIGCLEIRHLPAAIATIAHSAASPRSPPEVVPLSS